MKNFQPVHTVQEPIADLQVILTTDGIDQGKPQSGRAFLLLRALIETLEDALPIQGGQGDDPL